MKGFRVVIGVMPDKYFNENEFMKVVENNLMEVNYRLVSKNYERNAGETLPEFPLLNRIYDEATFIVEVRGDFDYRVALGCFSSIEYNEYPKFQTFGISPDFVEIK